MNTLIITLTATASIIGIAFIIWSFRYTRKKDNISYCNCTICKEMKGLT